MNNGDKPINPLRGCNGEMFNCHDGYLEQANIASGLTKREHFAGLAMQALLSNIVATEKLTGERLSEEAVLAADGLLKELESTNE